MQLGLGPLCPHCCASCSTTSAPDTCIVSTVGAPSSASKRCAESVRGRSDQSTNHGARPTCTRTPRSRHHLVRRVHHRGRLSRATSHTIIGLLQHQLDQVTNALVLLVEHGRPLHQKMAPMSMPSLERAAIERACLLGTLHALAFGSLLVPLRVHHGHRLQMHHPKVLRQHVLPAQLVVPQERLHALRRVRAAVHHSAVQQQRLHRRVLVLRQ
mmetsp:Transcript_7992/g.25048  ORF Transcript_7992/g.25048 Transcript_7992/m.25048 type:complete len:213 (+) Transcript_7992:735-1373(+)